MNDVEHQPIHFVKVALACGHMAKGMLTYHWDLEEPASKVECPEGCGLQSWIAEPADHAGNAA